jgi:hypothetical protein
MRMVSPSQHFGIVRLGWRKSTRCTEQTYCVEVNLTGQAAAVRDSKSPSGPVLPFDEPAWRAFVAGIKNGEFDQR